MTGSQKIFLRIVGLVGDREDADKQPDRLLVSGRGRLVPTITLGTADVRRGPDDLHEITLVEPVAFNIVNGMLTYNGDPYVWLPVPTGQWVWRIEFEEVVVDGRLRELDGYSFPLTPATPAQMNDPAYPGVNIAQYSLGTWAPGTVNLTAEAIGQITIMLNQASSSAAGASDSAEAAAESAAEALGYKNQMAADAGSAESARDEAVLARNASQAARTGAETARTGAETARDEAQTAKSGAETARDEAQTAKSGAETARTGAETARDEAQTAKSGAETARDEAQTAKSGAEAARTGAETARDEAEGHASDASGSASAAAGSASDASSSASAAAGSAQDASSSASSAAGSASGAEDARDAAQHAQSRAEDERVVAQDAAVLAEGHAAAADGHRVDAEAAAALAQSLRWVVRGVWGPGQYEAGDVVVWDERAYYAQTATSAQPPAQPWVPLTPAGGGASHWDELDGKPTLFPPEAHTHDGADISGALTDQVDASEAMVTYESPTHGDATVPIAGLLRNWSSVVETFPSFLQAIEDAVDSKSDVGHTHPVTDIESTGTRSNSTYLRGDGRWANPNQNMPLEEAQTGTANTTRSIQASVLSQAIEYHTQGKSNVGHTHTTADVTGLDTALAGKAATGHTHTWSQISDAPAYSKDTTGDNLVQRASNGHINVPAGAGPQNAPRRSEVDAALAGKASTSHTHTTSQVTGLDTALAGKASLVEVQPTMDRAAAAPACWFWAGTALPASAAQVHAQARVGDFIIAPNLASDAGWHRITGV